MSELSFIEGTHQYFLADGGVIQAELPALTNILKAVGVIDDRWYKPEHAERGKAIHRALEVIDLYETGLGKPLDWATVEPEFLGWIEAYQKFKENYNPTFLWHDIEEPTYNKQFLYACTPDRVFGTTLMDIKTGAPAPWHQLQLTGCAAALQSQDIEIEYLYGLYLKPTGGYKVIAYEPDMDTFEAILKVYQWGQK